jgi:transcriptional regulator with XRE-family HTH domain
MVILQPTHMASPSNTSPARPNRLRELREEKGEKPYELAVVIRRDPSVIYRYEVGLTNIPLDVLQLLTKHYGVSAEYLLGWTDKRRKAAA